MVNSLILALGAAGVQYIGVADALNVPIVSNAATILNPILTTPIVSNVVSVATGLLDPTLTLPAVVATPTDILGVTSVLPTDAGSIVGAAT